MYAKFQYLLIETHWLIFLSVLGVMENLVGDVRKMTYTTMPATLARPVTQQQAQQRPAGATPKTATPTSTGKIA